MKQLYCIAVLAAFAFAGAAQADTVPIGVELTVNGVTTAYDMPLDMDSDCAFSGSGTLEGAGYLLDWRIEGDADPALTVSFSFTNFNPTDVFVTYIATLPVGAIPPPTVTGGSVGGSVTDGNGDGVTLSDFSGALYTAQVNGAPFHTLLDAPYTLNSAVSFGTASIPVESFGIPGLTEPGPAGTVNDMAIVLAFRLSPHDAVAFTANFVLEPAVIPEPASLGLMSLGLVGLTGRAVRKMMRR